MGRISVLSLVTFLSAVLFSVFATPVDVEVEARVVHNKHHQVHGGGTQHAQPANAHHSAHYKPIKRAGVVLRMFNGNEIEGGLSEAVLYFTQDWEHGPVSVQGEIVGLDLEPNSQRGWHVHEFGDLTNGCTSAGLHWNPEGQNHGAPWDHQRHVGDLGNLHVDTYGDVYIDGKVINDRMSLNGPKSIIGRTLVIHLGTDDLGKGGKPDSLTVGASGGRLACGIIGVLPDH